MEKSPLHHWEVAMVLDCAREQGKSVLVEEVIHIKMPLHKSTSTRMEGQNFLVAELQR